MKICAFEKAMVFLARAFSVKIFSLNTKVKITKVFEQKFDFFFLNMSLNMCL